MVTKMSLKAASLMTKRVLTPGSAISTLITTQREHDHVVAWYRVEWNQVLLPP